VLVTEDKAPVSADSLEYLRLRIAELEASVQNLESRLLGYRRAFFENPLPVILYRASSLEILEANESALKLYGYERQQICSLNLIDLFSPGTQPERSELIAELRRPVNAIGPFVHRGSQNQELMVNMVSFVFDVEGVDARIAMIQDETGRHMAEEALRSSEERYRELFENANDVIFLHDLKGKIIAVNRAAEYLTGYSRTELLGQNFDQLVAEEKRHQTHDSIRAHLGGSPTQHYELPILSKFGKRRFLEVSTRIIYRRGHPFAIQGIGRDITERKQAQQRLEESSWALQQKNEELSEALRLAREATQLKEQFLANTSHELRTPMNGIMGMIDLLTKSELTDDQREYAEAISQCADDLLTIINDILDVSQIEAGRLSLTEEAFDMDDSLRTVLKLVGVRAAAKGLALSYEVDPHLPANMYGDSVRIRQILSNLIANAIKFTANGGVHVRLILTPNGSRLRCEVIDSGIGVEECVRERIFEAFFQADGTTRRRFGGTGLGLTICKQLVGIMGGEIGIINNNPGPGSTFWFELPLRVTEPAALAASAGSVPFRVK
jgi:two-component system, sensor histidine kinase and response regulator